jgi:tight adherence protein C
LIKKSQLFSQEIELLMMEIRSGFTRERALRNLALRTGVEEVDLLATMVNQSERFGTSIGDSLRVYADTARTKRRQKAEEAAAKIALKLLFPLLVCLMPAMFVVLLVPSLMQIKAFFS